MLSPGHAGWRRKASEVARMKRSGESESLLERGLQRDADFENRWPEVLGALVET